MTTAHLPHVSLADLGRFIEAALSAAGADPDSARQTARALVHANTLGVDSHGIRLLPYYHRLILAGGANARPNIRFTKLRPGTGVLDADDALGHGPTYRAMDEAMALARVTGIGAVTVKNSNHFGAAGAYAMHAAEQGMIGLATCNSDKIVRLHDGRERFHGTNPISIAAPVEGEDPWLLDMATSSIPFNRVMLYRSLGVPVPEGAASDVEGRATTDAQKAEVLDPVGGPWGYKGAALAGFAEIVSAVLSGMRLSFELPNFGENDAIRRHLGAFVLAIDPAAFIEPAVFDAGLKRYRAAVRAAEPAAEAADRPMAAGDREWLVAAERRARGVPIDPETDKEMREMVRLYGIALPAGMA